METVRLRKIPIEAIIDVLIDLFDRGVDYIDIIGTPNEQQDTIGITFCKEYMNEEHQEDFDNIETNIQLNDQLSDEDLNELL
jgi:hypothetical protein